MIKPVLLPIMAAFASLLLVGCPNTITPPADTVTPPANIVVNLSAIAGVTAPVTGATPVTTISETEQFTGTIAWSGTPASFAHSTVYGATIMLTAKAGYTFTGVAANSFSVAGATATNYASSGVVTATFAQTSPNLAAVSDVTSTSQSSIILKAVQGGTFNNGTANMTVSSLRMSQHEITMEQFVAVTGLANPSTYFTTVVNGPVQMIKWYLTLVFCNKLSVADSLTPVYSISGTTNTASWGSIPTSDNATWNAVVVDWNANGYRLPTEAEWQFAVRGGNSSHDYTYAGSNTIGDVAWYNNNSGSTTHPVGSRAANELGLTDMSGNVWEWCWDWYVASYPITVQPDYRGAASGTARVVRGGGWDRSDVDCTVDRRAGIPPYLPDKAVGFRIVCP